MISVRFVRWERGDQAVRWLLVSAVGGDHENRHVLGQSKSLGFQEHTAPPNLEPWGPVVPDQFHVASVASE